MVQVLIALLVIAVIVRLILKGHRAEPVLFTAGLVLMICTTLTGWDSVLLRGVASMEISFLNPFEMMCDLFNTRAADLGLMIMALMGFTHYMDYIRTNEAVVRIAVKLLRVLRLPYVPLFFSYLLASLLQLAIPSAAGLTVLLMGTIFPIMLGLGLSTASAAGVITTSFGVVYTPTATDAIRGSKVVNMDVVEYVVYHQGPTALTTVPAVDVCHFFWQRHCDRKAGTSPREIGSAKVTDSEKAPVFYALLPMLLILIAVGSLEMFVSGISPNIIAIVLISMTVYVLIE